MGHRQSRIAIRSGDANKVERTRVHSKATVMGQHINIPMVQNVFLIWLDNLIDHSNANCRENIRQFRGVINTINTFTDSEECIQFLKTIDDEKACMIISGSLGHHIMPHVHDMSQVASIFIYCGNKNSHAGWAKQWPKIKGVFTEVSIICDALKQVVQECEQNAMSMSFISTSENLSKKNLDQLDPSFIYTQILKDILPVIKFEEKHFTEFIQYCRRVFADNTSELKAIAKLEKNYRDETPTWWYTFDSFLYPMLNRAIRLMDIDILIKMGFFISDLHRHIDQLHKDQFDYRKSIRTFTVYRGQGITKSEFDQMHNTIGGLISFNNFLSTSNDWSVSFGFARNALTNRNLVGVLFVMEIDPSESTTSFASLSNVGYHKEKEDGILFPMHTVFRIGDIKPISGNQRFFQVDLTLLSEDDKDLRVLTDRIREVSEGLKGWDQLGVLLLKMGQMKEAEQVYNILLEQTSEESEKARINQQLEKAKRCLGENKKANTFNEKALATQQHLLSPNHLNLAKSYDNIRNVYNNIDQYAKVVLAVRRAAEI